MVGELTLDEIVHRVDELPALPYVTYRVLTLTSDPKTSIAELADTITNDQVLTAKVLRMANSAFYGYARRIFSINEALIILGFNTVRNLVFAASVQNVMDQEFTGYVLPKGDLWNHSMTTALLARLLSRNAGFELHDKAFTAGLLHDIGKIILNTYMKERFTEVLDTVKTQNVPFSEAEQRIFGFDHAMVGAKVAEKWNLPDELVEAIAKHHCPADAKLNPKLTSVIHIADAASMSMGIGLGGDGMLYPFDDFAVQKVGLGREAIEEAMAVVADSMIDTETLGNE